MSEHCQASARTVHCVNLDPAAEELLYPLPPSSSHPAMLSPWIDLRDVLSRYNCSIDVRELVSVEDVMAEMNLGPNGGLVYAMEYLVENIDWLQVLVGGSRNDNYGAIVMMSFGFCFYIGSFTSQDELGEYEDDYYLFDCPGQIELSVPYPTFTAPIPQFIHAACTLRYSHVSVMRDIVDKLQQMGVRVCAVYLIDSQVCQ